MKVWMITGGEEEALGRAYVQEAVNHGESSFIMMIPVRQLL